MLNIVKASNMFFKVVCICGIKKKKVKVEPSDLYYVGNVTLLKLLKRTNIIFEEGRGGGGDV